MVIFNSDLRFVKAIEFILNWCVLLESSFFKLPYKLL